VEYSVGDTLRVDGGIYEVIGKIQYKNLDDGCCWFEYRMIQQNSGNEKWLSYDSIYREYSISEVIRNSSISGYHLVDSGEEKVIGAWGAVDVEVGDRAKFKEYEDSTEEKILSVEIWDDGEELSVGYYLDEDEVSLQRRNSQGTNNPYQGSHGVYGNYGNTQRKKSSSSLVGIITLFTGLAVVFGMCGAIFSGSKVISKYLKKSNYYEYITSITGNEGQKADVYRTSMDLDLAVKDIIDGIEGKTEAIQQNTDDGDNSVAILTSKEYCLVYVSEDNETLIQVSTRKYVYTTDSAPYHSRNNTYRYYRRFYYSKGYTGDMGSFGKYSTPYSTFDDTTVTSSTDTYSSYADSVRQASVTARQSSGGGISSGK